MKKSISTAILLAISLITFSQRMPTYWKDRSPSKDYWQQDVAYTMEVTLHDSIDVIEGTKYKLEYTNNSPNNLNELYFHLFSNAFQPGSYYDKLWKGNDRKPKFGKYEQDSLGTTISNLEVKGRNVELFLDNTVLQVKLDKPIKPNETAIITMNFKTYFDNGGSMRRRMKVFDDGFGNKHYDAVHWYPSIACYDRKFGWTTDQHLDKEFYHDFGSFNVKVTAPQEYILDGTGLIMNEYEVMPKELYEKLKIENFKDKPFGEAPSEIIPKGTGITKTWDFYADLVHNFVFTADPTYRIGRETVKLPGMGGDGIRVVALAQEPHASKWQKTAKFTKTIIEQYSEQFGRYAWPKIIAADARDGMEYPMITIAGGNYPQHQGLLAHEIGHMWYYGMVGSNETYRAMMDEGFTQFLTVWFMDKMSGQNNKSKHNPKVGLANKRYWSLYYPYLSNAWEGYDEPLNTHSSQFNSGIRHGGGYGLVYYKTGVMLYNLIYVLGEDLFYEAMYYYFEKWKFCHPYPEDFRQAIIEYTKADLNWFFDQWLETTKLTDYAITGIKKTKVEDEYILKFARKERMQMPVDFIVISKNNDTTKYHIPNTWFEKQTDATILSKWYGWDLLNPTYEAKINVEGGIKNVIIDPEMLMADVDRRNNEWIETLNLNLSLTPKTEFPQWKSATKNIHPTFWYNRYDGMQIGARITGNYFGKDNFYDVKGFYNSRIGQDDNNINPLREKNNIPISVEMNAKQRLKRVARGLFMNEWYNFNAGILNSGVGLSKTFRTQDTRNPEYKRVFINTKYLINSNNANHQDEYLINPTNWSTDESIINGNTWEQDQINASVNLGFEEKYLYGIGHGKYKLSVRTPGAFGSYNYTYAQIEGINNFTPTKKLDIKTRVFGRIGTSPPFESSLYLAGANPEEMLNNDFTKADAFVPTQWNGYGAESNHFQMAGGLNLRGFAGYLAPENSEGEILETYRGNSGMSGSVEVDFDKFIPINPKFTKKWLHIDTYIFGDMGTMVYQNLSNETLLGALRADAGLGTAITFKRFPLNFYKPLTIRVDFPVAMQYAPIIENNFQFRYVIGINRTF